MIYLIKFIYSFVLPPGLFVVLLLLLVLWLWKRQRKPAVALLAITLLFYLSTTQLVSHALIGSLEKRYPQPSEVQGDVIVVLGGGATSSTPDIDGEGNLSGAAANRLLVAVRLHRLTGLPILFSGGQVFSDTGNEANIAKRQLLGLGIPEEAILVENRSLNTEQNAVNTAELLKEKGYDSPVLVTSAFHMPRSVLEFKQAGVKVLPYPADYWTNGRFAFYPGRLVPNGEAVQITGLALKEYLGLLAARIL